VHSYFESFTQSSPLVLTSDQTTSTLSVYAVSAVPEASPVLLLSLIGVGLVGRRCLTSRRGASSSRTGV
jgi:hypothetical protein